MADPTRERLILTAMRLFQEKGYGATSVADILAQASANSGSLYHFFPTKQDLLCAVLARYRDGIWEMLLAPAFEGVADPIDRVFALLGRYREALVATECVYGCPIGSLALELHEPDPPVRQLLAQNFAAWIAAVEGCFASAASRLPSRCDLRGLAQMTLDVMEGAVMQARTAREITAFDRPVAALKDYVDRLQADAREGDTG